VIRTVPDGTLAALNRAGQSTREIAERFGVSREFIRRHLKRAGVKFRAARSEA
jgi:transposase